MPRPLDAFSNSPQPISFMSLCDYSMKVLGRKKEYQIKKLGANHTRDSEDIEYLTTTSK